MVQSILHFRHAFFQLRGHGYMHHDPSNESRERDVTWGHRDLVKRIIVILMHYERKKRDLEDEDERDLSDEHDQALFHDKTSLDETFQVMIFILLYQTSEPSILLRLASSTTSILPLFEFLLDLGES